MLPASDPTYRIYLALAQYPILQSRIRAKMREELFTRGIISQNDFMRDVRDQAINSQSREGLTDPYGEEPVDVWRQRLDKITEYMTDVAFANNLPFELFEDIIVNILKEEGARGEEWLMDMNAELAPQELLFEQALTISRLPPEERKQYEHRLQEIKVVMIRNMISDQLAYIKIAKKWFTLADLLNIREHKIGKGKIGGKAAGMLLARRILSEVGDDDIKDAVKIPNSFFLGADVMYAFMAQNNLMVWAEQKYKPEEEIRADYPVLCQQYLQGQFPPDIVDQFRALLETTGNRPLIVRSSSLLEDNFGASFAGKYDSFFVPNQGTPEENLAEFIQAIIKVYSSALNPDALLYRRDHDLIDYDERIAVLIQEVQGEKMDDYFLPHAAGVAFSRNLYRWAPQIERDAGFLRLVWGMGTRAVDRVGNDYPRLVALSHPMLHSHSDPRAIQRYSQKEVDFINLKENEFQTRPVHEILHRHYPALRYVVQLFHDGYLSPLRSNLLQDSLEDLVVTMDEFLRRTPLADRMRRMLTILEREYRSPVDMEFTASLLDMNTAQPEVEITILQCRPQSHHEGDDVPLPSNIKEEDIVFSTRRALLPGYVPNIEYAVFVTPEGYFRLPTAAARVELGRAIGRLNKALADHTFICFGPGRWGTTNPDLGVRIGYGDIYHANALIELSGQGVGNAPEPSFGTHFFQDLIESKIYPLAIYLDDEDARFDRDFFYHTPNHLLNLLPDEEMLADTLRVIKVADYRPDFSLEMIMDDEAGQAVAFFKQDEYIIQIPSEEPA